MDFLALAFLFLLLIGIKFAPRGRFFEDNSSKDSFRMLKGIVVLVIIFEHIHLYTLGGGLYKILFAMPLLFVSVFFFMSGYGLQFSFQSTKGAYLNGYLYRRYPKVLLPYLLAFLLTLAGYLLAGVPVEASEILPSFVNGVPFVKFSWYVIAILFFYLAFYLIYRFCPRGRKILLLLFLAAYIAACYFLGYGAWWYNSCLSFLLGICWAERWGDITRFLKKRYPLKLLACGVLLAGFCALAYLSKNTLVTLFANLCAALLLPAFFMILTMKVKFKNPVLGFLGTLSFELYLLQGLPMEALRGSRIFISNDLLYAVAVLAATVALAFLLNRADSFLLGKYSRFLSHRSGKEDRPERKKS